VFGDHAEWNDADGDTEWVTRDAIPKSVRLVSCFLGRHAIRVVIPRSTRGQSGEQRPFTGVTDDGRPRLDTSA
jgi:hypothetical protein